MVHLFMRRASAFSHEVLEGVRGAQMSILFGQPGFGFLRCSRVLLHKVLKYLFL